MKLDYTYWQDEGFFIGFLDEFPGWWTQGKDIRELETMLLSSTGLYMSDGYYSHVEITNAEFNQMRPSLTDDIKHVWTESQLHVWFVSQGFSNTQANQEVAWLLTVSHGFIVCRTGSIVYMLIK
jgi:predicted RNase H-like HicB family nuclease